MKTKANPLRGRNAKWAAAMQKRDLVYYHCAKAKKLPRPARLKMGRKPKPKLTDSQRLEAIARRELGHETLVDIGRSYNVSSMTIRRLEP
jgi:hypothetical protein